MAFEANAALVLPCWSVLRCTLGHPWQFGEEAVVLLLEMMPANTEFAFTIAK